MITRCAGASSAENKCMSNSEYDTDAQARKEFTRNIFVWLDQIVCEKSLPSNGFAVAYVISQHLNRETGEAFPSTETIGDRSGLYPASVRAMVKALADAGHLAVEWGRKGRGHPNRYRMIIKPESWEKSRKQRKWHEPAVSRGDKKRHEHDGAVSKADAKPQNEGIKPQERDYKTAPSCHEPLGNNLNNQGGEVPSPPAVDRVVTRPVTDSQTVLFQELLDVYPQDKIGNAAKAFTAFQLALDAGQTLDTLLAALSILPFGLSDDEIPELASWLNRVRAKPTRQVRSEPELVGEDEPF
jgi:hypothetical protein